MPSSVTHSYFVKDVYNRLTFKNKLSLNNFIVYGQGPDPYFFYNFHLSKKSKEIHKINKAMQHSKVNEHFITLINYINEKNYYSNPLVLSYLYGQICHFVLDTTIHPFIIYQAGSYNEKNKETYKYNGNHEKIEYYIDIHLISKREKVNPSKYKVYKEIFKFDTFNNELNDVIDNVIAKVYNFNNVSTIYYKCLKDMKKFYYVFNYDPTGIKKAVYTLMDFICPDNIVKKKELSFHIKPDSNLEYLNLNKETWKHPCDGKENNYSFFELYNSAIDKVVNIINEVNEMLENKRIDNKRIEKLFNNLDYGTGKDCNKDYKYKYFKY